MRDLSPSSSREVVPQEETRVGTVHATILAGLLARGARGHAVLAFCFPPTAPVWAFRSRMLARGFLWIAAVSVYAGVRVAMR